VDVKTWTTISGLLDQALDLPPGERQAWVDGLGSDLDSVKPRLRELLAQAASMDRVLFLATLPKFDLRADRGGESPSSDVAGQPSAPVDDAAARVGTGVGPYTLVRRIGSGGQGHVWLAERTDGVITRPVALKLPHGAAFRPGLAERMARERHILAALTHPHIARLYDAGVTAQGEPYLALEYVEGAAIDVHARERGLSTRARVQLFLQVVRAVAFAHGQLVIHRDLKPSNILVTPEGYVRLLDFGIAKLVDGDATDSTVTAESGRAMTLAYASPEQVAHQPLGVASDVYSLAVVLFELLTGSRPYRLDRDSMAALEEAILVGESRRASEAATAPAAVKALSGDLDTILAKALKKDPSARYASAEAFADDLTRYLEGRPVLARPDSRAYRARKFIARHRRGVAVGAAALLAVLIGSGVALWQAGVARAEQARAEEVKNFITALLQDANPDGASPQGATVLALLKRAEERLQAQPAGAVKAELLIDVGDGLLGLGDTMALESVAARAVAEATAAGDDDLVYRARVLSAYANLYRGRPEAMAADVDAVLPALERAADRYARELAILWRLRASAAIESGRYADAVAAAHKAVSYAEVAAGPESQLNVLALNELAMAQNRHGAAADGLETARRANAIAEVVFRDRTAHPLAISTRGIYADALGDGGQVAAAVDQMERVVADAVSVFGPDHRTVAFHLQRLANFQIRLGRLDAAIGSITRGLATIEKHAEPTSGTVAAFRNTAGAALLHARRGAEAAPYLRAALDTAVQAFGAGHANTLNTRASYAFALHLSGRIDEARKELDETITAMRAGKPLPRPLLYAGAMERRDGREDRATALLDEAVRVVAASDRVNRWQILAQRGLLRLATGHHTGAVVDLDAAVAIIDTLGLEGMPDVIEAVDGLGRALVAAGRPGDAAPHAARVIQLRTRPSPPAR
jgi:eukaryotic-like serine/threonine-protein kinase